MTVRIEAQGAVMKAQVLAVSWLMAGLASMLVVAGLVLLFSGFLVR